jgi:hypothetical protein
MGLKTSLVETRLLNKFEFKQDRGHESGHKWYSLRLSGLPPVRTKVSHGKKELTTHLESEMSKQLRVRKAFFLEMMSCTKSKEEYYQSIRTNPVPPWERRIV